MPFGLELSYVADDIICARRPSYFACFYALLLPSETILIDAGMDSKGRDVVAIGWKHHVAIHVVTPPDSQQWLTLPNRRRTGL